MISVVIPVLNGAATIGEQLEALREQAPGVDCEVVVADNGSTDDTRAVVARFTDALPGLRVVDASARKGPAAARNIGAEAASGDVLAFCDADDVVAPGWLAAVEKATEEHDFMAGSLDFHFFRPPVPGAERSSNWAPTVGNFRWLKYGLGANMAVSRRAFNEVGGFSEEMKTGEDIDLSWRLQLAGHPLYHEPEAVVYKRPRPSSRHKARQHFIYGQYDVVLYKRLRSRGMPRRSLVAQAKLYGWLVLNAWRLVADERGRSTWLIAGSSALGRVTGSVRHRTLFL
ncbi:MAG TPA: glycosyltransferase [Acidimicrobiales bacterium]|nr:glycosyltransferase [Acidimicrobiales bacterium]